MATTQSTIDYIVDQLQEAGNISARKMFGEFALYCEGRVVGLVCDNTLFIKITEPGKIFIGKGYKEGYAYKGAKVSMVIDGDQIEDRDWLCELVRITAANVPLFQRKNHENI
ncbi:MAG: TfoX/Sxy family protein [Candidatus Gracilibacteria bacterium]